MSIFSVNITPSQRRAWNAQSHKRKSRQPCKHGKRSANCALCHAARELHAARERQQAPASQASSQASLADILAQAELRPEKEPSHDE